HPGQYIQPSSLKPDVVQRSLDELRASAHILTLLGGHESVLVLHLGGKNEDKEATSQRFVEVLRNEEEVLRYLAVENDERIWTVPEVVEAATNLRIPAISDTLHHDLNPANLTLREALDLSLSTWEVRGARPKIHISSQNPEKQPGAHAFSIDLVDWNALVDALGGREADVMVEAKGKEQALLPMGVKLV
ncbi:MAG: UV DNA damage repair endonuclease UvsE, partial [Rubrobacteraceae bacterium]